MCLVIKYIIKMFICFVLRPSARHSSKSNIQSSKTFIIEVLGDSKKAVIRITPLIISRNSVLICLHHSAD